MEDAATAEISRTQIWQWVHHGVSSRTAAQVTPELVREVLDEETARSASRSARRPGRKAGPGDPRDLRAGGARRDLIEFLTLPAYRFWTRRRRRLSRAADPREQAGRARVVEHDRARQRRS